MVPDLPSPVGKGNAGEEQNLLVTVCLVAVVVVAVASENSLFRPAVTRSPVYRCTSARSLGDQDGEGAGSERHGEVRLVDENQGSSSEVGLPLCLVSLC